MKRHPLSSPHLHPLLHPLLTPFVAALCSVPVLTLPMPNPLSSPLLPRSFTFLPSSYLSIETSHELHSP
jgi:hypothetical protein